MDWNIVVVSWMGGESVESAAAAKRFSEAREEFFSERTSEKR
jgi:hypothetical protein